MQYMQKHFLHSIHLHRHCSSYAFPTLAILGKSFFVLLTVEVFVHLLCIVTFQIVTRHTYKNIVASPIIFFCRVAVMDVKVGTFLPNDAGFNPEVPAQLRQS